MARPSCPRSFTWRIPTTRAADSSRATRWQRFTTRCPTIRLLAARRGVRRFRRRGASCSPPVFEDRLIRLRTFSKAYGMAGARIGYALATERNVATFQKIRLQYGVNRNAQIGALASLGDDEFRRYVVRRDRAGARRLLRASRESLGRALYRVAHELRLHRDRNGRARDARDARAARARRVDPQARRAAARRATFASAPAPSRCAAPSTRRCARCWPRLWSDGAIRDRLGRTRKLASRCSGRLIADTDDDVVVSLGDVVGYGPNPNECVAAAARALRGMRCSAITISPRWRTSAWRASTAPRASRDRMDARRARRREPRVAERASVRAALSGLSPRPRRTGELLRVHPRQGRRPRAHSNAPTRRIVFIGHTHIAEYWVRDADGAIGHKHMQHGGELNARGGEALHHRRRQRRAAARSQSAGLASCSTSRSAERVEWIRYDYPIAEVQRKMRTAQLPRVSRRSPERGPMSDVPFDDGNCFACGPTNPIGMHVHFDRADGADGVVARLELAPQYQGWRGIAHGGIVMALLDEAMAHAAGFAGHRGVTAASTCAFASRCRWSGRSRCAVASPGSGATCWASTPTFSTSAGNVLAHAEGSFVSRGRLDAADDRRNPSFSDER